jgi:hypothetical protein
MHSLKTIAHQLFALFFTDARFTLALVIWIIAASTIPTLLPQHSVLSAALFFFGFAGILLESLIHVAATDCEGPKPASRRLPSRRRMSLKGP